MCVLCDLMCDAIWCVFVFVALVCAMCLNVCGLIVIYCGRFVVLVCVCAMLCLIVCLCACITCVFEFVGVFWLWCSFVCVLRVCVFYVRCIV